MAGMLAVCFTHPLELTKTRLQLDSELVRHGANRYHGWFHCLSTTFRKEGLRGIQRGLTTAIAREAVFNGIRIGIYDTVYDMAAPHGANKLVCGLFCGALAAIVCNPIDILKVRLQSQGGLTGYQHQYHGARHAIMTQMGTEGLTGLFKGVRVNAVRGILGPGTQLPAYNYLKTLINEAERFQALTLHVRHAICAVGSAAISIACVNPVDVVRTRM